MATAKSTRAPSQTIGPFFHNGLKWTETTHLTAENKTPDSTLFGKLVDGDGEPVADAMLEFYCPSLAWGQNKFARPHGFARCPTDRNGIFRLHFVMPLGSEFDGKRYPPHLNVFIFARGLLTPLYTRVYFADSIDGVASDPVIRAVKSNERAQTLLARKDKTAYTWNIKLQGEGETVFFTRL
jgi:protocatechuate 3,4-dioxygenase, alpha subunit